MPWGGWGGVEGLSPPSNVTPEFEHWFAQVVAEFKKVSDGIAEVEATVLAQELPDLGDVTSAAVTNRHVLVADGSAYVGRALEAADIQSGAFVNDRISEASVTQHQGALSIAWSQLTSVPSTFAPSSHTHPASEITAGTFGSGRYIIPGDFELQDTEPEFMFTETDGPVNEQRWRFVTSAGDLYLQAREDDGDVFSNLGVFIFRRSGLTPSAIEIPVTNLVFTAGDQWLGHNDENGLFMQTTTGFGATLRSAGHVAFLIDANNNETTRYFTWRHNANAAASATEIMRLDEAGTLSLISAAVGTEIMSFPGTAGLNRVTTQGGWALWGDSSVWIHAGDNVTTHVADAGITPTTTDEHLYLTSDGHIYFFTQLQSNYAGRHEWQFATNGNTDFPTGTISAAGVITGMEWQGTAIADAYLAALSATKLTGTIASARLSGSYTGITGVGTITTGTWQGSSIADAYLTSLTATKLTGTIASARLAGAYTGITQVGTISPSLTVAGPITANSGNIEAAAGDVIANV